MSDALRSFGLLEGLLFGLLIGGLGLATLVLFRPLDGLRRGAQGLALLASALLLAGLLLLGNPGGWGLLSLAAGSLGLRALQVARKAEGRWLLPGALLLIGMLHLGERAGSAPTPSGLLPLMLGLPWALGFAELLLAGLLGVEEGFPAPGRWLDLKGVMLGSLRWAFIGLALALLLQVLGAERLDPMAGAGSGALLLLLGALLHLQRVKGWPRRRFLLAVMATALLGLGAALFLPSLPLPAFGA